MPGDVKKKGSLTVAADATYAPNEFIGSDGKTVVGMDADLAKAIGHVLGLRVNVVNATFATIIPRLASGKYDLGMSSFTDTKEREKTVDFVTYFTAGTSFYVKTGGPTINSLADLCGHSVGVERGTTQADAATAQDAKCKKAGKAGVTVSVYPDQSAGESRHLERSRRGRDGRLAGRRVHRPEVERQVQADRQGLRHGALRHRDPEGQRDGEAGPGCRQGADRERHLRDDPEEVGYPDGAITNPQINGAVS